MSSWLFISAGVGFLLQIILLLRMRLWQLKQYKRVMGILSCCTMLLGSVATILSVFRPDFGAAGLMVLVTGVFFGVLWLCACLQIQYRIKKIVDEKIAFVYGAGNITDKAQLELLRLLYTENLK